MKPLLIVILLVFVCHCCHAQKEFDNMAMSRGFIFNVENESVTSTGKKITSGQFAISDVDGNLVAFGDASHIYDKNGDLLYKCDVEQGLSGMSCVAINPKNQNQFYIFNSYEKNGTPSAFYDYVVTTHFFVVTNSDGKLSINEKILNQVYGDMYNYCHLSCALPHSDGDKIWLVAHNERECFVSYLIDDGEIVKIVESNVKVSADDMRDLREAIKTNPEYNKIFLQNGEVLDFDSKTGILQLNTKFKIPQNVISFDFSQSGDYMYCIKIVDDNFVISRYNVSELEKGFAENEYIIHKEQIVYSGANALRKLFNIYRHPNSIIYVFCYQMYISKIENIDSKSAYFVPLVTKLPSSLNAMIPFSHYLHVPPDFPCKSLAARHPKIICE